jgi:hypothetical protein
MKKSLLVLLALFFVSNSAFSAIRVSPSYLELNANKSKKDYISSSFTVAGAPDETIRFKVYPEYFEIDKTGKLNVVADKGQPNSLLSKLQFYPSEFTCKEGKEQKVRFTITKTKTLPPGESRILLFLEDTKTKEILLSKAESGINGKIIVKTRVGVPIYVDKGNFNKKGNLEAVAIKTNGDNYNCEYKVKSLGNSKIRYSGVVQISQKNKLIKEQNLSGMTVPPNGWIEAIERIDIPKDQINPGQEYKVNFILSYKDERDKTQYLKKEFTFIPAKQTPSKV